MVNSYVITIIIIIFVVFLLLREFWCWYAKQNKIIKLLTDIYNKFNEINTTLKEKDKNKEE